MILDTSIGRYDSAQIRGVYEHAYILLEWIQTQGGGHGARDSGFDAVEFMFPEGLSADDVMGLLSCEPGYNIQDIANAGNPVAPEAGHRLWYQYYLHGARGYAGLEANRDAFCRLLWKQWSPTWDFTDQAFQASAQSFNNPDFFNVVTHSYRHRFGLVDGDPHYVHIQKQLALQPGISVPTVILGSSEGVTPAQDEQQALGKFTGRARRLILDGIGHNVPQEAPADFAQAVLSLLRPAG